VKGRKFQKYEMACGKRVAIASGGRVTVGSGKDYWGIRERKSPTQQKRGKREEMSRSTH